MSYLTVFICLFNFYHYMYAASEWYKHDMDELLQIQRLSLFELDNPNVVFAATMASDISMLRTYLQRHPQHVGNIHTFTLKFSVLHDSKHS